MMLRVVGLALTVAAVGATPAAAEQVITAGKGDVFVNPRVTIDQGQTLSFRNADIDPHNVTATQAGPDGKPLFASETVGTGKQVPVRRVEYLTTGSYGFLCSVHPFMTGTLEVTGRGTPVARPAPAGGTASAPATGGADTRAPRISVVVLGPAARGRLRVRVVTDEAATVSVRLLAARGRALAHRRVFFLRAGRRTIRMGPRRGALRVAVRAVDPSGNVAHASGRVRR